MNQPRTVLTVGTFDGVHVGHRALLARARTIAQPAGDGRVGTPAPVVALVFDPHPATVLRPGTEPARLTTFEHRRSLLTQAGADCVVRLEPTQALLSQAPEQFIARVASEHRPLAVVEGTDFRFGHGRTGDADVLRRLGPAHGFRAEIVEPVEVALSDHSLVTASSTITRWLLRHGRVRDAAAVLGRPYSVTGTVGQGDRRGRTIGFPTANVQTECTPPGDGVYAGRAILADGRRFAAAVNVGERPTFAGARRTIEAHLLDAPALIDRPGASGQPGLRIEGLPEYGWTLELEFVGWLRDQVRFESLDALRAQLARDCERARRLALTGDEPPGTRPAQVVERAAASTEARA